MPKSASAQPETDEFKGTPGPWRGDRYDGSVKYRITGAGDETVLVVDHKNATYGFLGDKGAEDELLVLAAPDIFKALSALIARMDRFGNWEDGCFYYNGQSASELQTPIEMAYAAIAKALGK